MATLFNIVRGSVKMLSPDGGIQPSIVKIDGFDSSDEATLVSNFSVSDNEKLGMIQCFNDTNHLYAFGHDPENSGFSVTYIAFMGQACMKTSFSPGSSVEKLVAAYNQKKVSASGSLVTVSFGGGKSVEGVVCSMDIEVFDPEMNALTVTVAGKALRWN